MKAPNRHPAQRFSRKALSRITANRRNRSPKIRILGSKHHRSMPTLRKPRQITPLRIDPKIPLSLLQNHHHRFLMILPFLPARFLRKNHNKGPPLRRPQDRLPKSLTDLTRSIGARLTQSVQKQDHRPRFPLLIFPRQINDIIIIMSADRNGLIQKTGHLLLSFNLFNRSHRYNHPKNQQERFHPQLFDVLPESCQFAKSPQTGNDFSPASKKHRSAFQGSSRWNNSSFAPIVSRHTSRRCS